MTNPRSNDTGLPSEMMVKFMIIELAYSCKLLLPIKEGNDFLSAYSRAREWKEEYKKPITIMSGPPEIKIKYITNAELVKIKFDDMLGLDKDE